MGAKKRLQRQKVHQGMELPFAQRRCVVCRAPTVALCPCPNQPGYVHPYCGACHAVRHHSIAISVVDLAVGGSDGGDH